MPASFRSALLLFLLLACLLPAAAAESPAPLPARSAKLAEQAFSRGAPVPAWVDSIAQLPAPSKGGAFSARLADVQFYVDGATSTVFAHRAFVANDASALGALGQYELGFQPDYQQVELHLLRIHRAGQVIDKLASADIRFLQRELNLDQGIYSGTVTAAIVTDDVRVGDTLEMKYSVKGQNPVFAGKFFDSAQWDSPYPVALRRVSIDTPAGRKIHHRLIGNEQGKPVLPTVSSKAGRSVARFVAAGVVEKLGEPYVPSDVQAYRYLQFSEFDQWRDLNAWALGLFGSAEPSSAMDEALRAARAAPTRAQAVAAVLEFVQNEIRYLSVSLGENSHRPYPPAQVLQRRYGDCKDKSLLMVSMLRELGIEAAPVLVSTDQRRGLDRMLPSPLLFDHAIVRAVVDGKEYYLDPTRRGQYGELARMGQTHSGSQGLVIASGATALSTIGTPSRGDEPDSSRTETVTVQAMDKPVEMRVQRSYSGVSAEYVRLQLASLSKEQLHKAYDGVLGDRYPSSRMVGEPVVRDDRQRNTVLVESHYRIDNFFEALEHGWQLRYVPSNMTDMFYVPGNARREHPLALPNFPSRTAYALELQLPDNIDGNYKDLTNRLQFAAVSASETLSFQGRNAAARVQLDIGADRVAPDRVIEFLDGIKKFNVFLNGNFTIRKTDLKGARPEVVRRTPRQQLEANLAATTRLVADAELAGQDASDSLCERALVRAYLGQEADAVKDAARAVQQRAQSGEMWRCRAEALFVLGKFQDGESDYNRAIARGADTMLAYLGKGLSGLYLNKLASARIDFVRAAEKSDSLPLRQQVSVWQAIASWQERGQPSAAGVPAEAREWRAAALDMFARDQAPDAMLRLASRDGGNSNDSRLAEAYFYAGKYYQLKKDTPRARAYFQRAIDKGMLDNLYHTVSRHELARLDKDTP